MTDYALSLFLSVILALLSGLLFGEKETIIRYRKDPTIKTWAHKAWFPERLKGWWLANNWYYKHWITQQLMRYPLAVFKDGYHWCGGVSVFLLICSVMLYENVNNLPLYADAIVALCYYGFHGIGANASMHDWYKNL